MARRGRPPKNVSLEVEPEVIEEETIEEEEVQPVFKRKHTGVYRTTGGFHGNLTLKPARVEGINPDGSKRISRSIAMSITRLGVERANRQAVGIINLAVIPEFVEMECRALWGDQWEKEFDKCVGFALKEYRMKEIKSGDDIDLYAKDKRGPDVISSARTISSMKPAFDPKGD